MLYVFYVQYKSEDLYMPKMIGENKKTQKEILISVCDQIKIKINRHFMFRER